MSQRIDRTALREDLRQALEAETGSKEYYIRQALQRLAKPAEE